MLQISTQIAEHGSRFDDYIAGALTAVVLALSAIMFFSPFLT